jgi:hypothetical protein
MRKLLPILALVLGLFLVSGYVVVTEVTASCWCARGAADGCRCEKSGPGPFGPKKFSTEDGVITNIDIYCDTQEELNSFDALKSPICGSSPEVVPWCSQTYAGDVKDKNVNTTFWVCWGGSFMLGESNINPVPVNGAVVDGTITKENGGQILWNGNYFGSPDQDNHYSACSDNLTCCGDTKLCTMAGVPNTPSSCEPQNLSVVPPVGVCGIVAPGTPPSTGESRLWFSQTRLVAVLSSIAQTLFNPFNLEKDYSRGNYNKSSFSKNTPVSDTGGRVTNQGGVTSRVELHQGADDTTQSVGDPRNNSSVIVGRHAPPPLYPFDDSNYARSFQSDSGYSGSGSGSGGSGGSFNPDFDPPTIDMPDHDDGGYNGRIGGTIYDCNGKPINGIEVQYLGNPGTGEWGDSIRDDTYSETIDGKDGQWRITINDWNQNTGRKTFGLNVGKDTHPDKNYPYFTKSSSTFIGARGDEVGCSTIDCSFRGGFAPGGPSRRSYASIADRWDSDEDFQEFFIRNSRDGDRKKIDNFALGFDFVMVADADGNPCESQGGSNPPPETKSYPGVVNYGDNPYDNNSACFIPETIDRAGDDLAGARIKGELLYTEEFSFTPVSRPPGCIEDNNTYTDDTGAECCSKKRARSSNQCLISAPIGGYCLVPLPAGVTRYRCDPPDPVEFETTAEVEVFDKTPLIEHIYNVLLVGKDSLYKRFMPHLTGQFEEIPTSTGFTASVTGGSGSPQTQIAQGQSDSPILYIPRLGTLDKYWLEEFQKSIRPQGYGRSAGHADPISSPDNNAITCSYSDSEVESSINNAASKYRIPPSMLQAILEIEGTEWIRYKNSYTCKENYAGAAGIMQVVRAPEKSIDTYSYVTCPQEQTSEVEEFSSCVSPAGKLSRCDVDDVFELAARTIMWKAGLWNAGSCSAKNYFPSGPNNRDDVYYAACDYYGSNQSIKWPPGYLATLPNPLRSTCGSTESTCMNYCDVVCNKMGICGPDYPPQFKP